MASYKIPWLMHVAYTLVSATVLSAALMLPHAAQAVSPAAPPQAGLSAAWLQGWPMVGHDPQRTNRSPNAGPARPRLQAMYRDDCSTPLIGPNGSIYGWCRRGLTALTAAGHRRWAAPLSMIEGSPPVLAPNGLVLATANSGRTSYRHLFVVALSAATGATRWTVHALPWSPLKVDVPNSKGLAPLVTPSGLLYMPFAGPEITNAGVEVFSPTGQPLRRLLPHAVPAAIAMARGGTIYDLGGQGLVALTPQGAVRWRETDVATSLDGTLLVGRTRTVYVADGAAVVAIAPDGRLRWRRDAGSTIGALAERADGAVLAVGAASITAVDPAGRLLWHRALGSAGPSPYVSPSIAVDARGYAFVDTSDGMVREIAPNGTVLWAQRTGTATPGGIAPSLALGPGGTLVVAGIDGRLRIYR